MAQPKKGTLHQVLVPMVDATDFASVESGITASDFNSGAVAKFYGLNTGGSAATTSGTVSKIASLVRSGVFRITLKTTENNYDMMMLRINKTGCAEQILTWENVDNDDSDIVSAIAIGNSRALLLLSNVSDVQSAVLVVQSMASDAASAAQQTNSRVLLNQSRISDIASYLVVMSGIQSDLLSAVAVGNSRVLIVQSQASDLASKLSDVESNLLSVLGTTGVQLNASSISDLRSAIAGVTATLSASDISDIASAVKVALASDLSDIYSAVSNINSLAGASPSASDIASKVWADTAGAAAASRILLIVSRVSDAQSAITVVQSMVSDTQSKLSDVESNLLSVLGTTGVQLNASSISDLRSAIGAITVSLDASNISDIASAVVAALPITSMVSDAHSAAAQANSRVLLLLSNLSDVQSAVTVVQSMASDAASAAQQANSRVLLNQSRISDIASYLVVMSGIQSDLYSALSDLASDVKSAVAVGNSRVLVNQSGVSDIYSRVLAGVEAGTSTMSDLRSAIAAAQLTLDASALSDIASAVWSASSRTLTDSAGIKKNTALANFEFFMVDSADHYSGKTGLVVTATRSIDGAAFAACANAVTEVAAGVYKITLAAADLNGDVIGLKFTATGADATIFTIKTAP